ncbi:uridine nucleosidase [Ophiostoma piceae UAMH 11346]|uniref:Uridine nucleosidase n=1 Tax=Ophiostoma piceae (strain UAMH 11346) TaxID=1262450 RepID=S3D1F3_OPHP1|nr:uridine nucleosidase [Ophiostoma piceae UAMH 11346]
MTTPIPLWLDCDPGHDDVFAILMSAYHPSIELLGISTVYGNAPLKHTTWNATSILTSISKEDQVKVYAGAIKPISRPPMTAGAEIHGESGLDGTDLLPQPAKGPVTTVGDDVALAQTVEAMAAALLAQPAGTAWLVATGCLTNVALLLEKYPEIAAHLAGLSIMGGAIGDGFTSAVSGEVDGVPRIGNTTMFAEFNILLDPEAAAAVFDNPVLAKKTTLVPLDLTHLVLATAEVQDLLLHGPDATASAESTAGTGKTTLRTMLVQLLNFFADTYSKVFGIKEGPPLHDPIAVAAVLTGLSTEIPFYDYKETDASKTPERFEVKVVTDGTTPEALAGKGETGRTVARLLEPGQEGVRIPRGLDIPLFWKVIEECTTRADEANAKNSR